MPHRFNRSKYRSVSGQSAFELVTVIPVLATLSLLFIDLGAVTLAAVSNQNIATTAARAAALQGSNAQGQFANATMSRLRAKRAAEQIINTSILPPFVKEIKLTAFNYSLAGDALVRVQTSAIVSIPCPMAGWSSATLSEAATEPILSAE